MDLNRQPNPTYNPQGAGYPIYCRPGPILAGHESENWGIGESLTPRANYRCQNWRIGESLVPKLGNWGILLPPWRIIATEVGELNFRELNFRKLNLGELNFGESHFGEFLEN